IPVLPEAVKADGAARFGSRGTFVRTSRIVLHLIGFRWKAAAALQPGPAVLPDDFLYRRLPPQNTASGSRNGAAAQMCKIPAAPRPLAQASVSRFLKQAAVQASLFQFLFIHIAVRRPFPGSQQRIAR